MEQINGMNLSNALFYSDLKNLQNKLNNNCLDW